MNTHLSGKLSMYKHGVSTAYVEFTLRQNRQVTLLMFCNDSIYLQKIYLQMGLVAVILTKIKRCALQIYEEV